jgi:hypothetical protein
VFLALLVLAVQVLLMSVGALLVREPPPW